MNNLCISWFFMHILMGILIFEGLTVRHLYKLFSVKGLMLEMSEGFDIVRRGGWLIWDLDTNLVILKLLMQIKR
jgi:hypothetical protein